jgi:hypothetical protein
MWQGLTGWFHSGSLDLANYKIHPYARRSSVQRLPGE